MNSESNPHLRTYGPDTAPTGYRDLDKKNQRRKELATRTGVVLCVHQNRTSCEPRPHRSAHTRARRADPHRRNHTAALAREIDSSTQPSEHEKGIKRIFSASTSAGKRPRICWQGELNKKSAQIYHIEGGKHERHKTKCEELLFTLKFNKIITDSRRSPSSLYHLMRIKNMILTHFYTINVKIRLESGKEP
jgi:ribosomal protein S27AE